MIKLNRDTVQLLTDGLFVETGSRPSISNCSDREVDQINTLVTSYVEAVRIAGTITHYGSPSTVIRDMTTVYQRLVVEITTH